MNDSSEVLNLTLRAYLQSQLGVQTLPLPVVVPLTVLFVLISITGIVGNVLVCMVIARHPNMQTATNYYLFSLALSDITILVFGLPNDLYVYWHQYPWDLGEGLCKFRALISEATSYASVLTIVAFSTERYLAICHPLHAYTMSGLRRASRIIAAIWLVSLACAIPFASFTTVNYLDFPPGSGDLVDESAFCGMLHVPDNFPLYETSSVAFFLVPMLILVALYTRMGILITQRQALGESHRTNKSRKSILRMLAAVVISFFVCWAPFHLQRLLFVYLREIEGYNEYNEWIYHITGCFYYFSSTVNPILYNLMSAKYRIAFKATLCGGNSPMRNNTLSAMSRPQQMSLMHKRGDNARQASCSSGGAGSWLSRQQSSSSPRVKVTLLVEEDSSLLEPIVLIVQNNGAAGQSTRIIEAVSDSQSSDSCKMLTPDILANTLAETSV
ncbi:neuropeptides capa receptor-like isoform X2 [Neocloeon triangulifer]|uniref:neuropeptides capa receptor-like isoform X2 n=1 Tax=Neocloeon triangulifer TaxID=2078957 RepID=UPI00286F58E0|nr:neuropeptides capa receptor-like isoform X2 [Neocloeon triangulifer]